MANFFKDLSTLIVSAVLLGISFGLFLVISIIVVISALSVMCECSNIKIEQTDKNQVITIKSEDSEIKPVAE